MKIDWAENPLCTKIVLTDEEKNHFKTKIQLNAARDRLATAHFYLSEREDWFNLERARRETDIFTEDGEDYIDDAKDLYELYLEDLNGASHIGDCTCFAASCSKCQAEHLLGIDTIEGLGKHEANKIQTAFKKYETINEVLWYLKDYKVEIPKDLNPAWGGVENFKKHIPRWEREGQNAYVWLKKYRDDHFVRGSENVG